MESRKQRFRVCSLFHGTTLLFFLCIFISLANSELALNFQQDTHDSVSSDSVYHSRYRRDVDSDDVDVTGTESENNDPKCAAQKKNFEDARKKIKDGHRLETTVSFYGILGKILISLLLI